MNSLTKLCFVLALPVAHVFAVTPTIGVVSAVGSFVINSSVVEGNANLFDGSQIKTTKAASQIFLQNGAALVLGVDSSGTIFRDHLLLEAGATKVDNMAGFSILAGNYQIRQGEPSTQAVVRLTGDAVQIAALSGSLNVFNEKGALLTRVGSGTATSFQAQTGAGANGTTGANTNTNKRRIAALTILTGITLAGLGIAIDAILQPTPTSP